MKCGKYNSYVCQTMWNNANHVLSLWAELSYWAELRYCAELSYWAELSCWLLWVIVVQLGWRSPALLYWRRGGLEPGVEEPGGMEEEAKDISVSIFCLSVWLSVALASCHTLVVDSWHVKPFLQKKYILELSFLHWILFWSNLILLVNLELMLVVLPGGQNWNQLSVEFSFLLNVPAL